MNFFIKKEKNGKKYEPFILPDRFCPIYLLKIGGILNEMHVGWP